MREQLQDERIIQETHRQNSVGFAILYFGLLLDLLYRQFILRDPVSQYWDLALLFFGVTFFLAAKRIRTGLLTGNAGKLIPSVITASVVFLIVNYWWLDNREPFPLLISCIIFVVGFYAVNVFMQYLSRKKNEDLLDDD